MTRVKVCGMTNCADALAAIKCGADAIGFLVNNGPGPSERFITASTARDIIATLPPLCTTVLVTTETNPTIIEELARATRVTTVQCHAEVSPDDVRTIRAALPYLSIIKSVHVSGDAAHVRAYMQPFDHIVDAFVLDTAKPEQGLVGGTGETHDWTVSAEIVRTSAKPIILAGGLTPHNVRDAITTVQPYAVDANSGVSRSRTEKDPEKMRAFIHNAHITL